MLMSEEAHNATRGVFSRWRSEMAARQGVSPGQLNWSEVSPGSIWRLAEEQFQAAGAPSGAASRYFQQFNDFLEGAGWSGG
jgi:hypothetical protein